MIVAIHQPAYLPWLGYFHKLALADIFVFFDTTQFEKNSFINRNKIKTPAGSGWLTVPVSHKNHFEKEIREIGIADGNWQEKHWKAIELNYKKAAYWSDFSGQLKEIYQRNYKLIADVCYDQLKLFLRLLAIKTRLVKASEIGPHQSKKQQLILDLCRQLGATAYISGKLGRHYLDERDFSRHNIKLIFQDYQHPQYPQLWGEFLPFMAIIDLLFNCGQQSLEILMKGNLSKKDLKQ